MAARQREGGDHASGVVPQASGEITLEIGGLIVKNKTRLILCILLFLWSLGAIVYYHHELIMANVKQIVTFVAVVGLLFGTLGSIFAWIDLDIERKREDDD